MKDQADKLRSIVSELNENKRSEEKKEKKRRGLADVYAITSGKGGVGKSNFTANLALALKEVGENVIVFDADLGMANLDVLLGVSARYNLIHVINGEKKIKDIIIKGPKGLDLIPGGSGIEELANLSRYQIDNLIASWQKIETEYDIILIDTAAGLANNVINFVLAANQIIVIATPEPTAITDAYGVIKTIAKHNIKENIKLVINQAENNSESERVSQRIIKTAENFLEVEIDFIGSLPKDDKVVKAVKKKRPFIIEYPKAKVSKSIVEIAEKISSKKEQSPKEKEGFFSKIFNLVK